MLIIADDQAYTDFGFMAHEIVRTPHLDELARQGAVFPNGYVPTSLCRASLAALLTGRYGHENGVCFNDPPPGVPRETTQSALSGQPTIPRVLAAAGYLSFQTGKFWEGHYQTAGFTHGMTRRGRHGGEGLVIGRTTVAPIAEFLDGEAKGRPFFLWYAPMLPHRPHQPPERFRALYAGTRLPEPRLAYYAMISWFDDTVGQVLQLLSARGLRESTLVAFVVDNGWVPGPETSLRAAPRSKNSPFEHGTRTPVVLSWPGRIPAARHEDVVSTVDVMPTLLAAARVAAPSGLRGLNLLGVAEGTQARLGRDAIFGEVYVHTARVLGPPAANLLFRWIRQGSWKLIVPASGGRPEFMLYDLGHDQRETRNLALRPEQRARVDAMRQRLDQWWNPRDGAIAPP